MNLKFWEPKSSIYDEPIERVLTELREQDPVSDDFKTALAHLNKLQEMKAQSRWKFRVSPDTIVMAAAPIIGILVIAAYEERHAMVSKGMNYVKFQQPSKPNIN